METKVVTSKQFSLNVRDFLRGLLTAMFTAIVPTLNELALSLQNGGEFHFYWKQILGYAISGGIGYLILNFISKSKVIAVTSKESDLKDTEKQIKKVV